VRRSPDEVADYLLEVGATLASCGCPSYRLEDTVRAIAVLEGFRVEPFALPTGFFLKIASSGADAPTAIRMTRVKEGAARGLGPDHDHRGGNGSGGGG
jgi:uncharacterized membrane protein YjjP (DUF1212 family)